jgi:hypothetical protein
MTSSYQASTGLCAILQRILCLLLRKLWLHRECPLVHQHHALADHIALACSERSITPMGCAQFARERWRLESPGTQISSGAFVSCELRGEFLSSLKLVGTD